MRRILVTLPVALAAGCAQGVDPPEETKAVFLAGGEFTMGGSDRDPCDTSSILRDGGKVVGCQNAHVQSEVLQHQVKVAGFCLDEHEVTIDQYRHCVARDACSDPKATNAGAPGDPRSIQRYYRNHDKYGAYPVLGVTIEQAREFCAFHGGRLPTEVEWEYAARSGGASGRDVLVWEGPNVVDGCAGAKGEVAYGDCGDGVPKPVKAAALDVTEQGVFDLAGNAQEWVDDEFSFFAYCAEGQADLYRVRTASDFQRSPEPDAPVPASLLAEGEDATCVDVPPGQAGHNTRDGGCIDQFESCSSVCSLAWRNDPSVSLGQRKWREETCQRQIAGVPAGGFDCSAPCDGDDPAACEAYCQCLDEVAPAESGGECVQACIADAVTCMEGCAADGVVAACINVSTSERQRTVQLQPICRVRGSAGAPFEADGPLANEGGPLAGAHVVRGGHFQEDQPCGVRVTRRESRKGTDPSPFIGFRCAYDAGTPRCRP